MNTMTLADTGGPYATAAVTYWDAGWRGVLPLPARKKASPPMGWTGREGAWPSRSDIQAWMDGNEGHGNLGLRLPVDVVGIDVDNYSNKLGARSIGEAEARWGKLPPTWRSTSRDDGVSGISLYRIPEGLAWPGEVGPGIEIIQHIHRYVVAWPSIHPEGRTYRWITPDGVVSAVAVPTIEELPELPDTWVMGLTNGQAMADISKAHLTDVEITAWLLKYGSGDPCGAVRMTVDRYISQRMTGLSSRHDAARDATARLFRMATEGHTGIVTAVNEIGTAFRGAIMADTDRVNDQGEWQRLYMGAIKIAAVDAPEVPPSDPCNVTILDISTVTPQQAALTVQDRALEAEMAQQRTRREAKRLLDAEDALKSFREPDWLPTLADELLIPDVPIRYAVDKILPNGGNVLFTAQYKAGKTTLMNNLAKAIADGEPFLGRFDVDVMDGRIALFNYEVGRDQYRSWLRDVGIDQPDRVAVLNLRGYRLPITVPSVEDWVVRWLSEREAKIWVIDPFARAFGGFNENDNSEVSRWLDAVDVIKERAGVTELILPTHTGRAEFEEGQERARGATRLDDWADVRWFLNKDEDDSRYFRATGRDVEFDEEQLSFDQDTRRLYFSGGDRKWEKRKRIENAVAEAVATEPGIPLAQLRTAVRSLVQKASNDDIDSGIHSAEARRLIRIQHEGAGKATKHFPATTILGSTS